jgi:hypothetical protein
VRISKSKSEADTSEVDKSGADKSGPVKAALAVYASDAPYDATLTVPALRALVQVQVQLFPLNLRSCIRM